MLKIKKIIFVIITIMIIGTMCTVVNATNDGFTTIVDEGNNIQNSLNDISNSLNTQIQSTQNTQNALNNLTQQVNNLTTNNTNTNTTITSANSLPKAGASQTISLIVTGVIFGISSLYAYRKINEYNIK